MEAVSTISWPAMLIGARSERRTCSASMASSRGSAWLISSSANWSPPTRASVSCGPRLRSSRRAMVSSRLSPTTSPSEEFTLLNLSMSMNSTAGRISGSSAARLAAIARRSRNSSRLGRPGQAVVHGIVHQPLLRALGVRHLAHQADAAQVAAVGGGHARRLQLEPAVGAVDVAHAELGAQLAAGALLHRPQQQLEALAVGGMHVLGEVVGLGGQLARP